MCECVRSVANHRLRFWIAFVKATDMQLTCNFMKILDCKCRATDKQFPDVKQALIALLRLNGVDLVSPPFGHM